MDYEILQNAVKKIALTEEAKARIIRGCEAQILHDKEAPTMNMHKTKRRLPKPALAAAVIAFCLCFGGIAAATGCFGHFQNIAKWDGTVVGTKYEQATAEINVTAAAADGALTVCAAAADPTVPPYSEIETLGIAAYKITDAAGSVISAGEETEPADFSGGTAEITLPAAELFNGAQNDVRPTGEESTPGDFTGVCLTGEKTDPGDFASSAAELSGGEYTLVITAFVGAAKADQPLLLEGTWECSFTLPAAAAPAQ